MTTPSAQPPPEPESPRLGAASAAAAGLKAVGVTARLVGEMGVARGVRALLAVNQADGFDCQSCAWPSPDADRHMFEFCENGAKAVADEATPKRIGREFFAAHSVAELAAQGDHWLNAQGRLAEPLVLRPGAAHYAPITWDEAFEMLAKELRALPSPDAAAFYTSGRTSNEAAFLWQLFARQFGTNNLPDCSNMCHESSSVALGESIGIGKGTVTLEDFEHAEAMFVIGQNPGTNHPRMLAALANAKARGAMIVSINPLPEVGTERFKNPQDFMNPLKALPTLLGDGARLSDVWLQSRTAGDLAVFKGLMKAMLAEEARRPGEVLDQAFIGEHTSGFEALAADLRAASWDEIIAASGVTREELEKAAAIATKSRATICCWAMGLTQQPEAVATIQQVVNFLLLRGNHRQTAGRGRVSGARALECAGRSHDGHLRKDARLVARPARRGVCDEVAPRAHGLDTVDAIRAMHDGRVRVFVAMGGNFLSATPDTEFTAAALRRCRAHGARFHEAQPRASRDWPHGADLAVPRPQ